MLNSAFKIAVLIMPFFTKSKFISSESLHLLSDKSFRLFIVGTAMSVVGNQFSMITIPFLILHLGGGAQDIALAVSIATLGPVILSIFSGSISDAFRRKPIILFCEAAAMLSLSVMAALYFLGKLQILHIYLCIAITSLLGTLSYITKSSAIRTLVGKDNLQDAKIIQQYLISSIGILTPVLAGICIAVWGLGLGLVIDILSFLATFIAVSMIRGDRLGLSAKQKTINDLIRSSLDGFIWVASSDPKGNAVLKLSLLWVVQKFIASAPSALLVYFLVSQYQFTTESIGFWNGLTGIMGLVLGLSFLKSLISKLGYFLQIQLGLLLSAITIASLYFSPNLYLLFFVMTLKTAATTAVNTSISTAIQLEIPDELMGRVLSAVSLITGLSLPVGAAFFGYVSESYDNQTAFLVAGILGISVSLLLISKGIKQRTVQVQS
ncbi:hypothetical protein CS022_13130 [Veronia nyctiphanis]|uniref:Major facilitator superfamily (MFS) profile domain-containing protein n=1 Tax=Veronia nyctiphanis TaxID=1278244 RepID=A0A4Q0YQC3_9GAMM|nr:MFS transporter [Veronia nyctiphanis]RXJ72803.1 hypothetical protein CS022_13130 [Veronia nyctiphanis]